MPAVRHYEVDQTRRVVVAANNPTDAAVLANQALQGEQGQDEAFGYVVSDPRITDINVMEA